MSSIYQERENYSKKLLTLKKTMSNDSLILLISVYDDCKQQTEQKT